MRVFIAEKPSLANAIFVGLGGNPQTQKKNGYFQNGSDIVTWCFGHLLSLRDPEDYDPDLKRWTLESLPIATKTPPKFKPKPSSKKQLDIVLSLIKQATSIVHAGDPDPEGCLLVDEILDYANNSKPVERLLIADLNEKPVKQALANMQPNENFKNLTNKALARSLADQSFGYNLTRSYTLKAREKGFDSILNIGRVISALLGMVNQRTLGNINHLSVPYFELHAQFDFAGEKIEGKLLPNDTMTLDEDGRMIDEGELAMFQSVDTDDPVVVEHIEKKEESRQAPMPFNLSKLQIAASKSWGYKPQKTLDIVQKLYETHKLLTYPRSDNQYLSDAHLENSPKILEAIKCTFPAIGNYIPKGNISSTHKAFDSEKIEAHHAIIPTEKDGSSISLTNEEKNIYQLVAQHFVGLFLAPSKREKTTADIVAYGLRTYRATSTTILEKGWEVVIQKRTEESQKRQNNLSKLSVGEQGDCQSLELTRKETKPAKYFDDASLLKAMTEAAKFVQDPELRKQLEAKDKNTRGENGSIGTEATRSGLIEKLGTMSHFVEISKEKGYKNPVYKTTKAGQDFCALLPKEIIMPDISAIWEGDFEKIEKGKKTVEAFIAEVDRYIEARVNHVKSEGVPIKVEGLIECPKCDDGILVKRKGTKGFFHACNQYPNCKTSFPDLNGKPNLTPPQKANASDSEKCPDCQRGLIRREAKRKGSFWWGCSGFPTCKTRFFDKDGLPDREKGKL